MRPTASPLYTWYNSSTTSSETDSYRTTQRKIIGVGHVVIAPCGGDMDLTPIQRQILHYLQDAIPTRRLVSLETLSEQLHIAPLLLRTTVHAFIQQGYIGAQQM